MAEWIRCIIDAFPKIPTQFPLLAISQSLLNFLKTNKVYSFIIKILALTLELIGICIIYLMVILARSFYMGVLFIIHFCAAIFSNWLCDYFRVMQVSRHFSRNSLCLLFIFHSTFFSWMWSEIVKSTIMKEVNWVIIA